MLNKIEKIEGREYGILFSLIKGISQIIKCLQLN